MTKLLSNICTVILLFISMQFMFAQDDVMLTPERRFAKIQIGGQASFISNDVPYNAGGGFWMAYSQSLKKNSKIELGAHFEYNFMSSSSIEFDDGDDYFSNRGSVFRLNMNGSYHPFRLKHLDIYPEVQIGSAFNLATSTYFADQNDEEGNTEKVKFSPAINAAAGFGIDYRGVTIKVIYHQTTTLRMINIKEVTYKEELIFPQVRAPLGGISIYLGIVLN